MVLNDVSRQTRLTMLLQMFGPGLMFGAVLAIDDWALVLVLFLVGLVASLGWLVAVVVWTRVVDRRAKAMLGRACDDIVAGRVTPVPVTGRVVRSRAARRSPAFLVGAPPFPPPSVIVVVTALVDGGARRVGSLVPTAEGLYRKAPVALLLHPTEREAGVLDPNVTPDRLAAISADPRWTSERLPTDRTVVGGWLPLLGCSVLGLVTGLGVDAVVVALAT